MARSRFELEPIGDTITSQRRDLAKEEIWITRRRLVKSTVSAVAGGAIGLASASIATGSLVRERETILEPSRRNDLISRGLGLAVGIGGILFSKYRINGVVEAAEKYGKAVAYLDRVNEDGRKLLNS